MEVARLTVAEHAGVALRHWGGGAAAAVTELWLKPDRLLHALYHGKPMSAAEQVAYVKSREWVPVELRGTRTGWWIWFLGVAHQAVIAVPVKNACRAIGAAADKPLRFWGIVAAALILVLVLT
jgi:hypothetical protein